MSLNSTSNGHSIPTYVSGKRRSYKTKFSAERRQRLKRIKFVLSVSERNWEKGFAALERFKARNGHCRVPRNHIEGKFRLGRWVFLQRDAKGRMLCKNKKRLYAIGFILDRREIAWEEGFAAITKFKAREGHCRVPRYYIEGTYKLGQWVSVQRLSRDKMSAQRRKRLDAIEFIWGGREHYWENGFAALAQFKAREGHCRVPSLHIENKFKLGQWVTTRRRSKDKVPSRWKLQLDKIGFVWRAM